MVPFGLMLRMAAEHHTAEDVLERYAMAQLSEAEAVPVEEHLLICQSCRERVAWLDELVSSIRSAARVRSTEAEHH